jgi:hypothetical protein
VPQKWVFEQLGGARKKLELEGWNAPFGRPRQKAIFDEVIKVDWQTTRYPGSNSPPTRHHFGSHWEDMEMNGRWMTKAFVAESSEGFAYKWSQFVRDAQRIRISWGNILAYTGFIDELRLARESDNEVVWRMKLLIDKNDEITKSAIIANPPRLQEVFADLQLFLGKSKRELDAAAPDMSIDILEAIDNLSSLANIPSATLARIVGQVDAIEKMAFTTLQHFRNAITGITTSLANLRGVILNGTIDSFVAVRSAETDIRWLQYQLQFDQDSALIMADLRELDRRAEIKQYGDVSKFITAIEGDTWESISIRATGGIDKAGVIRSANGIRYGERPVPSESYVVP